MRDMKQLLLRVPEDLQRRLVARAASEGRSVNAVVTEILDLAVVAGPSDRRSRLRAKAIANGLLRPADHVPPVSDAERRRAVASTRGLGRLADRMTG